LKLNSNHIRIAEIQVTNDILNQFKKTISRDV